MQDSQKNNGKNSRSDSSQSSQIFMQTRESNGSRNFSKINGRINPLKKLRKIRDMKDEFKGFLWEYSVAGLAIGVIIGGAVNSFVQSLVNGILTPLLQLILPYDAIKNLSYTYNGVTFSFGPLISAFLNLVLVALIIFLAVKYVFFKGGKIDRNKISKT